MKTKPILLLSASLFLAIAAPLTARTWTDAATGRTLEGDYVESDATHVVIKSGNGAQRIDIARLSEADQAFIEEQAAKPAEPAAGPFALIASPVTVESLPVTGKGKDRKAGLEVTNNSDKAISKLRVGMFLFNQDGGIEKSVPHTSDNFFGKRGEELGKGQDYVIDLTSFWIKDDIASVAGLVKELTWDDGTEWPAWTGPAPEQEGDSPVSFIMKGVLGAGDLNLPLIECFNHSDKGIQDLMYRIVFLDAEGNELLNKRWGAGSLEAGKGVALVGFEGPPKSAVDVKLSLLEVTFDDDPGIAIHSPLTAAQIAGRKEVSGGNWKVSFEEERYLGFFVTETSKDSEKTLKFHWSAEPSLIHEFHFDHHANGKDHEVTFSPAGEKDGDGPGGSGITRRFSDPELGHQQRLMDNDMQFRPAGPRIGQSLRGPLTLYSLQSPGGKPVFDLKIVFVEDTAAAEEALTRAYEPR